MMGQRNEEREDPRTAVRHSSRQEFQHTTTHRNQYLPPSGYNMDQSSLPINRFRSGGYGKFF
jgi:hypothetical protein